MTRIAAALLAVCLVATPLVGWSQTAVDPTATPRIDQRVANQAQRTEQGVASGNLTKRESARLQRQQSRIQKKEAVAKSDGVVTKQERRKLTSAQNAESRRIARQKTDAQKTN